MKRILSKVFVVLTTFTVILSSVCLTVSAKTGTTYSVSNQNPKPGDTVTITVTISADEEMYSSEAWLSFDSSVLNFVSGTSANMKNGSVYMVGMPGGETFVSHNLTFTAVAEGRTTISIYDVSYVGTGRVNITGASGHITVSTPAPEPPSSSQPPAVSNNANLSSLKVSAGTLSPKFNANTQNYNVEVENNVSSIKITAAAAESGAKINGAGTVTLKEGDNKRVITVTAPDGSTKKTYTVNIKRLAKDETTDSTPSDTTSDTPPDTTFPPSENPYSVRIENNYYQFITNITVLNPPAGFESSTTVYNGIEIPIYKNSNTNVMLYGIADENGENSSLYFFNEVNQDFIPLVSKQVGDRLFILAEPDKKADAPKGYYSKKLDFEGSLVSAFGYNESALKDFAIIYCNVDGQYGYYRYDSFEGTLQRALDFKPIVKTDIEVGNNNLVNNYEGGSLLYKLKVMPIKGKIVLAAAAVAVLAVIALTVILIIYVVNRIKNPDLSEEFSQGFDYEIEDAVALEETVEETTENQNP